MAHKTASTELRNMQRAELEKEVQGLRAGLRKMRLGIELKKEKDTARYKRDRRQLARMMTVLGEMARNAPPEENVKAKKPKEALRKPKSSSRVSARPHAKR